MPVDDAITLITRSFDKYMLDRRERTDGVGAAAGRAAGPPPPTDGQNFLQPSTRIQNLLNMLADNRYLTPPELTLVIDYLVERRRQLDPSGDVSARAGQCNCFCRTEAVCSCVFVMFLCCVCCLLSLPCFNLDGALCV